MQFKLLAATLFASTGLCAAAPLEARQGQETSCPRAPQGDWIWKVDNLVAVKPDGEKIGSLSFDVEGTAGNFRSTCSSNSTVEPGKFYPCNDQSALKFAFQGDRSGLLLYQVWNDEPIIGSATTFMSCEHGGATKESWICKSDGSSYLSMVGLPAVSSNSTA